MNVIEFINNTESPTHPSFVIHLTENWCAHMTYSDRSNVDNHGFIYEKKSRFDMVLI